MPAPYRVLMIVDHKWRDLPGLAVVKVHLEDRFGIAAEIVPFGGFEAAMLAVKPHMVVLNHVNGTRNQFIARVSRKMGCSVTVLPTEGRPQNNDLMKYVTGHFADRSVADLWLTWSETVRQVMIDQNLQPAERIRATGSPRFDFYTYPLRSALMPREAFSLKHGLVQGRLTVTWATNFILARHVRTNTLDFMVGDFKNLGVGQLELYSDPVALAKLDLKVRLRTLEILKRLCGRFPMVNFVLKPHPHEETGDYEAFATTCRSEGIDNLALVTEEYIWDVLNASDILIHRLCTTGIEAWLMDVSSINFHIESYGAWTLDGDGPSREALAGDDVVTDENNLAVRIAHYLGGGKMAPEQVAVQSQYIERWFYRVDGRSSLRCAEEIAAHLEATRPEVKIRRRDLGFRPIAKIWINRLLGRPVETPIRSRMKTTQSGVPVDFLGQRDKSVRPEDVVCWAGKVRSALASRQQKSPAAAVSADRLPVR